MADYEIAVVRLKGDNRIRQVWRQRAASGVRKIEVTADLNKHYAEMLARLPAEPSSAD